MYVLMKILWSVCLSFARQHLKLCTIGVYEEAGVSQKHCVACSLNTCDWLNCLARLGRGFVYLNVMYQLLA